jgi:transcriptional regulator with XRE-family HTH domain
MDIGSVIRHLRKQQGLTLKELSESSGMSVSHLSDLERGRTDSTVRSLLKIAEALGVTPAQIFGTSEEGLTEPEWRLIEAFRGGSFYNLISVATELWWAISDEDSE